MSENNCFITFPSSYHVLQAEKAFRNSKLKFTVVPIPREITSSCGMAIMYNCEERKSYEELIALHNLFVDGFHELPKENSSSLWSKIIK